jgi:hypothetical protein
VHRLAAAQKEAAEYNGNRQSQRTNGKARRPGQSCSGHSSVALAQNGIKGMWRPHANEYLSFLKALGSSDFIFIPDDRGGDPRSLQGKRLKEPPALFAAT